MLGPNPPATKDLESTLAEWETNVPLFMRSLPEDEEVVDPKLAALQSLVYEGTPDEVALNFKEQGNEYFLGKRIREAKGFYTQGIDAKPTDTSLLEALLCNRAACNLELKNYGWVLGDCSKVLTMNDKSWKGYYRSALALLALDRYDEGIDCCSRCPKDNKEAELLKLRIINVKERKQARVNKIVEAGNKLQLALKERNLVQITSTGNRDHSPRFDPSDPSTMLFPVFFLYPQYSTSDLISNFSEDTTFKEQLDEMFSGERPDWDMKGEYRLVRDLVVYGMVEKRVFKIGKKMKLREVFKNIPGLELKDGTLVFVVVPKGAQEDRWVSEIRR